MKKSSFYSYLSKNIIFVVDYKDTSALFTWSKNVASKKKCKIKKEENRWNIWLFHRFCVFLYLKSEIYVSVHSFLIIFALPT